MESAENTTTNPDIHESGSAMTWESFQERFIAYLLSHGLDAKVQVPQMRALFDIVDENLRELSTIRTARRNKPLLLQDHRRREKLMEETIKKAEEFKAALSAFGDAASWLTSPKARSVVVAIQKQLEDLFYNERHMMEAEKRSIPPKNSLKTAGRELTIDLLRFIQDEFPDMPVKEKDVLIGASKAGAGFFSQRELQNEANPVENIPTQVSRAKKHHQKFYLEPGVDRVYAAAVLRKTKEQRKKKKQG